MAYKFGIMQVLFILFAFGILLSPLVLALAIWAYWCERGVKYGV
jgi:hypothetical protein